MFVKCKGSYEFEFNRWIAKTKKQWVTDILPIVCCVIVWSVKISYLVFVRMIIKFKYLI